MIVMTDNMQPLCHIFSLGWVFCEHVCMCHCGIIVMTDNMQPFVCHIFSLGWVFCEHVCAVQPLNEKNWVKVCDIFRNW